MTLLNRILDARAEILALTNAILVAAGQFGFNLNEGQQTALNTLVSAVLVAAARILMYQNGRASE
jgi:hypothetical protein